MNRVLLFVLLCLAALSLAGCVVPATAAPQTAPLPSAPLRLITVTGDAEVRVVPDEIVLTVGAETSNRDLEEAKAANDAIVKAAIAVARQHGIDPGHIQTEYIHIEPRWRDSYERRDFIGYFVNKTVVITLRDLERFEPLLTDLLASGITYVHGIEFRTTELRKHKDAARSLAIIAAKEKAADMAGELGQSVGLPHEIREESVGWWSPYSWWGGRWSGGMAQNVIQNVGPSATEGESAIAPGRITVRAQVSVSFELVGP